MDRFLTAFGAHKKWLRRNGWLLLLAASSWFYLAAILYGKNWYGVYKPGILIWGILAVPLLFLGLAAAVARFVLPRLGQATRKELLTLLGLSLALAALLTWLFPPPWPAIVQTHSLELVATGEMNPESRGAEISLAGLRAVDGIPIHTSQLQLSGDWRPDEDRLVSKGEAGSTASLQAALPAGLEFRLNFHRRAGKLLVRLDGYSQEVDLYSPWDTSGNVVVFPSPWGGFSLLQKSLIVAGILLYFLALASLLFLAGLAFHLRLLPAWLARAGLVLAYLVILVFYTGLKRSYANFNAERVYGDTKTYVRTAQIPLTSSQFWFNNRTFTLPLLYKAAGLTPDNFTDIPLMRKVGDWQTWVSILCWTALGLAVAANMRKRWLGPVAFALILFFSLSLDVSLWDRLMYSESISFSLFALLVALWIGLETLPARWRASLLGYLFLFAILLASVLFSFTRDTNLYFVLAGAAIFVLAVLLKRAAPENRKYYLIYAVFALGLFIFQNMTIRLGDRWQIHVFDNLVRRVLVDAQALEYFQEAGLPVSDRLLELKDWGVFEYQTALEQGDEPEYTAVREWVNRSGQSTYIRYLIDHPDRSLLDPVRYFGNLINGSNVEYRYPVYPNQPVPDLVLAGDRKFYLRSLPALLGITLLFFIGMYLYWTGRDREHPAWLALAVLGAAILPMAFIIWNGNPLEIERHASQLGQQFRLIGWAGLMLLVDRFASHNLG